MKDAKWLQLTVWTSSEAEEPIENFLLELGSVGLWTEQSAAREKAVRAFFLDGSRLPLLASVQGYLREIRATYPDVDPDKIEVQEMIEADWAEDWKRHFIPLRVGERFLIEPSWCEPQASSRVRLVIDPGMAFGTGSHGSTRGCLQALEGFSRESMRSALDVGTGSGILAIALAKLGAQRVLAIDLDEHALAAVRRNVEINGVGRVVQSSFESLEDIRERFFLIVANLFAEALVDLRDLLLARLEESGGVVLSGILKEQEEMVRSAYEEKGCVSEKRVQNEEWVTLVVRRITDDRASLPRA
jgi:ribosomal protein L11 methyltransferase